MTGMVLWYKGSPLCVFTTQVPALLVSGKHVSGKLGGNQAPAAAS